MPLDGSSFEQPDEVMDLLRNGRSRVAQGWVQNKLRDGDKYCAVGAVIGDTPCFRLAPSICSASVYLEEALPNGWRWPLIVREKSTPGRRQSEILASIINYNNHARRTQDEIVALFDDAIAARQCAMIEAGIAHE